MTSSVSSTFMSKDPKVREAKDSLIDTQNVIMQVFFKRSG